MSASTSGNLTPIREPAGVKRLKEVRLPYGEIWLGDDGIMRHEFYRGTEIGIAKAKEIGAALIKVCGGKIRPVFSDGKGIKSLSRDARIYFASEEISHWSSAVASYNTPIIRALGKFYTILNKPPYPIKYFGSKENAIEWLREYL